MPHRPRRSYVTLATCAALGAVFTLFVTALTLQRVREEASADTNTRLDTVGSAIERQISGYAETLYGLRAAFAHEPDLTGDDFHRLVDFDALTRRNPGAELVTFNRREGTHLIVDYLEPRDPKSPVLGVDINAEPTRRAAADFARSSGELSATQPVTLIQGDEPGFLLMLAAYDVSPIPVTAPSRDRHFLGVLVTVFAADTVLEQLSEERAGITFSIYDAGPTIEYPRSHPRPKDWIVGRAVTNYTNYADIDVGSRRWRVVTDKPVALSWAEPLATAAVGFALTLLISGVVAAMTLSRRRAVNLAEQMTEDLRTSEVRLREAKEEAEQANMAKSEFLSQMSHELRTPLTAILGFTELLQMGDMPADQRDQFVDRTHRAGQHLLALINDILDISRVETGSLTVSLEPLDAAPLVEQAIELIAPMAQTRRIAVANTVHDAIVMADMGRLRQVLLNLLSNAVKYNRESGTITISSRADNDSVAITVSDTGPGIPARDIPRLFQPFDRLGVQTGEIEGTGIGLAISRGLVDMMGGTITVNSVVGEGTRFTVTLPAAERQESVAAKAASPEPVDRTATVLYIEDNTSNTVLVESALSMRPHIRFISAIQGQLGLELAREHQPDLILLDLHLPDMSGDAVLAALQADERTAVTPVIVVSADATQTRIRELLAAGAHDYITKPLVIKDFLESVDNALAADTPAD